MIRQHSFSVRLARLVIALLCWAQLGHIAHALPIAKLTHFCGHASLDAIEPLASFVPDEYGKSLRQLLGCDTQCELHGGTEPIVPPALRLAHARPTLVLQAPGAPSVPLGASRFGRFRPPATAPPALS